MIDFEVEKKVKELDEFVLCTRHRFDGWRNQMKLDVGKKMLLTNISRFSLVSTELDADKKKSSKRTICI